VFTVIDPRGYSITLTDQCWYGHILNQHPEMNGREDDVRQTVETPDSIYESKSKRNSHLYFRATGTTFVLVVVDVRPRGKRGFAQTALLVEGLSKGGSLLWQKL
jgi:hypothetical protein